MLFIVRFLLIGFIGLIASFVLPWWNLMIVGFLVAFMLPGNNFNALLSGFLGGGILWLVMAWKIDIETASIMSKKIVQLFPVNDSNMLVILTGLIGGVATGLGAFTGNSFRQLFLKKKEKSFYS